VVGTNFTGLVLALANTMPIVMVRVLQGDAILMPGIVLARGLLMTIGLLTVK
jgi:hypothetical protein